MSIYVTGDIHGGIDMDKLRGWELAPTLTRADYLIIAGDFGFPWDFSEIEEEDMRWLESQPYTTLFVDGNHERYDYWLKRPYEEWHGGKVQRLRPHSPVRRLCRGEVFDFDGITVFTLGGATSTDKMWRTPGESWWPQELPSEHNFACANENLGRVDWSVDYVITHTCSNRMLPRALYPAASWQAPDFDRLTDYLDTLEDKLAFKHWYFGHMHNDRDLDEKHTLLYDDIVELGKGLLG